MLCRKNCCTPLSPIHQMLGSIKCVPNYSKGWLPSHPPLPLHPLSRSINPTSKLIFKRSYHTGSDCNTVLSNAHRHALNAEIHRRSGRPLSLRSFIPHVKPDAVLEVAFNALDSAIGDSCLPHASHAPATESQRMCQQFRLWRAGNCECTLFCAADVLMALAASCQRLGR